MEYGKKFTRTPKTIEGQHHLEKNLEKIYEKYVEKGNQYLNILVVGEPGAGKTSLSLYIQQYLLGGDINTDWIALDHDEWKTKYTTNHKSKVEPPKKVIIYEEGRDTFNRRNVMSRKGKDGKNIMMKYRGFQNTLIINYQDITDFNSELIKSNIIHIVIRAVKTGFAHAYDKKTAKRMFNSKGKFTGWVEPSFKFGYKDPKKTMPEKWEAYEKENLKKLDNTDKFSEEEKGKEEDTPEASSLEHLNISAKQLGVLKLLDKKKWIYTKDVQKYGIYEYYTNANRGMKSLMEQGWVNRTKDYDGKYKGFKWFITDKGRAVLSLIPS